MQTVLDFLEKHSDTGNQVYSQDGAARSQAQHLSKTAEILCPPKGCVVMLSKEVAQCLQVLTWGWYVYTPDLSDTHYSSHVSKKTR